MAAVTIYRVEVNYVICNSLRKQVSQGQRALQPSFLLAPWPWIVWLLDLFQG